MTLAVSVYSWIVRKRTSRSGFHLTRSVRAMRSHRSTRLPMLFRQPAVSRQSEPLLS